MPRAKNVAVVPLETIWELPDELWERLEPVLAGRYPPARTGQPRPGIVVERLCPASYPQRLCLDKGYDNPSDREATEAARRWVVERTLAGLSKCRATLVRYDKNPLNYLALIQLACARLITSAAPPQNPPTGHVLRWSLSTKITSKRTRHSRPHRLAAGSACRPRAGV